MKDMIKTSGPATISKTLSGWEARATMRGRTVTWEGCASEAEAQELVRAAAEAAARALGVSLPSKAADRTLEEMGRRIGQG